MITVFEQVEQHSGAWFEVRRGLVTCSEFHTVLAKGGSKDALTRRKYLYTLAGEILTGEVIPGYANSNMERGRKMEEDARAWYEYSTDADVVRVGFIRNDMFRAGVSPDGLIGNDGMFEAKTKLPHLQLELLDAGTLPNGHKAQCQGALWVTGRSWIDFVSYWPKLPPFKLRVYREEPYIAALAVAVKEFNEELDALVARWK